MGNCFDCTWFDPGFSPSSKGYCERYRQYYYGNESACSNFKDKNYNSPSLCYITTVVHEVLGKDDKCKTMQNLRFLRDEVMQKDEKFSEILKEYDTVGPVIAGYIDKEKDKDFCSTIYDIYLVKISNEIEDKNYLKAITDYEQMTTNLAIYYGVSMEEANEIRNYDYTKGGHGKVYILKGVK